VHTRETDGTDGTDFVLPILSLAHHLQSLVSILMALFHLPDNDHVPIWNRMYSSASYLG